MPPPTEQLTTTLWRDADAPSRARRAVTDALESEDRRRDDAALLASELVTNVVRHAPRQVTSLHLRIAVDPLLVSVTQESGFPHQLGARDPVGGMGLRIVDALSTSWGFSTNGSSLEMWFQIEL